MTLLNLEIKPLIKAKFCDYKQNNNISIKVNYFKDNQGRAKINKKEIDQLGYTDIYLVQLNRIFEYLSFIEISGMAEVNDQNKQNVHFIRVRSMYQ